MPWLRLSLILALRGIAHPRLGSDLLRVAWRFRSRNWHRRFPFLPFPDATYVRWRMYTAYGRYDAVPTVREAERYASWAARDS